MRYLMLVTVLLSFPAFMLNAPPAWAQSEERALCPRRGVDILAAPLTMTLTWPKDAEQPPILLERPAESLFDDMIAGETNNGCEGNGIAKALECGVTQPMRNLDAITLEATGDSIKNNGDGTIDATTPEKKIESVVAEVLLQPVINAGPPVRVTFIPEKTQFSSDWNGVSGELARRVSADLKKLSQGIAEAAVDLDGDSVLELAEGEGVSLLSLAVLRDFARSPNATAHLQDTIRIPEGCAPLINLYQKRARDLEPYQDAATKLRAMKQRHKALIDEKDLLKRLGNEFDWDSFTTPISTLETQIKRQEKRLQQLGKPLNADDRAIQELNIALNEAEENARLSVIRDNPDLIEKEKLTRTVRAKDAYREFRNREKIHAETLKEYRKGLAKFDTLIAGEADPDVKARLEGQRARYQKLADGWSDQSRGVIANRYRDLDRELTKNAKDKFGPKSVQELVEDLKARGENPAKILEGYQPESLAGSVSRAALDALTLGGSASDAEGAWQFVKDTAEALDEERDNVVLTPADLARKLVDVVEGRTTIQEVYDNQAKFGKRFGQYAKGAAVGGVKGLYGVGELAYEASSLQAEIGEALAEDALSKLRGKDVKIDYFGDSRRKKINKASVEAGNYIAKKIRESGKANPPPGIGIHDVLKDPALVGDYILDAINPASPGASKAIASGTTAITKMGMGKLERITRGGEKALGEFQYDFGKFVGEVSDLGAAATVARQGSKAKKLIANIDQVTDATRGVSRADSVRPEVRLRQPEHVGVESPVSITQPKSLPDTLASQQGINSSSTARFDEVPTPQTKSATGAKPPLPVDAKNSTETIAPLQATPAPVKARPPSPRVTPAPDRPAAVANTPAPVKVRPPTPRVTPAPDKPAVVANTPPANRGDDPFAPGRVDPTSKDTPAPPELAPGRNVADKTPARANENFDPNGATRELDRSVPAKRLGDPFAPDLVGQTGLPALPKSAPGKKAASNSPARANESFDPDGVTRELNRHVPAKRLDDPFAPDLVDQTPHIEAANNTASAQYMDDPFGPDLIEPPLKKPPDIQNPSRRTIESAAMPANRVTEVPPRADDGPFGNLKDMDTINPPEPTGGHLIEAPDSPYKDDMTVNFDDIPVHQARVVKEGGRETIIVENRAGGQEKFELGKQLGAGAQSKVYAPRSASTPEVTRVTDADDPNGIQSDIVGRELLSNAQSKNGYFRVVNRTMDPKLVEIAGKRYLVSKEEQLEDAKSLFERLGRKPNAKERLTMHLAIREMNQKGLLWADHKMQNFALVKDPNSRTGYKMVVFDTGYVVPMKGNTSLARAENARMSQKAFDLSNREMVLSQFPVDASHAHARVDTRPFGGEKTLNRDGTVDPVKLPIKTTIGSNAHRSEYLALNKMSKSQLKEHIAEQGLDSHDLLEPLPLELD